MALRYRLRWSRKTFAAEPESKFEARAAAALPGLASIARAPKMPGRPQIINTKKKQIRSAGHSHEDTRIIPIVRDRPPDILLLLDWLQPVLLVRSPPNKAFFLELSFLGVSVLIGL